MTPPAAAWKRRGLGARLLLVALAGLLGGFAWLTRHPESEILERAVQWPVLGRAASAFRGRYLPAGRTEPRGATGGRVTSEPRPEVVVIRVPPVGARQRVWVEPGTVLRQSPADSAPASGEVDVYANLALLERRGDWFHLERGETRGWVLLEGYDSAEPPLGSEPAPMLPLPARPASGELLAAVSEILGDAVVERRVAGYFLLTDREDTELLDRLGHLVGAVEPSYRGRYELDPVGAPAETIVLFSRAASFQRLQSSQRGLSGLATTGWTSRGLVAITLEDRSFSEIGATLVHELAHLLNRRSIGAALPAWLEEGLADDLGLSRIEEDGTLRPGTLGGLELAYGRRREWHGGKASVIQLQRALDDGSLPSLGELVALDWPTFLERDRVEIHYGQAAFFVRFLLDTPAHEAPFRAYLEDISAGGPATGEALGRRLGVEWSVLDEAFAVWLRLRLVRASLPS